MNFKILFLIFVSIFLTSCNTTNPFDVKKTDTQKITSIKYGNIVSSLPVKVKGEGSMIGTTTGAYIINVDDSDDDIAIVQGSETLIKNGERVVIIFGKTIRVLPYSG